LLQRSKQVLSKQTEDVASEITKYLKNEGVEIHTGLVFDHVSKNQSSIQVYARQNGEKKVFTAAQLLVSTGIQPNTSGLEAEKINLELTAFGHIEVNERLETNLSNIFAAGD